MILRATHTHLYPGHRGTIAGLTQGSDWRAGGKAMVEFSDGSVTTARLTQTEGYWLLFTDAYRTAAGTGIAEKRWRIEIKEHDGRLDFRILRRDAGGDIDGRND